MSSVLSDFCLRKVALRLLPPKSYPIPKEYPLLKSGVVLLRFVSNSAIGAILTAVAGLIAGTFMLEIYLVNAYSWGHTYGPPIASCINVLQIEVVSRIAVVRFSPSSRRCCPTLTLCRRRDWRR